LGDTISNSFDAGILALEQAEFAEAIAHFEHYLKDTPSDADALSNLALAHFSLADYAPAIAYWKRSIDLQALPDVIENIAQAAQELLYKSEFLWANQLYELILIYLPELRGRNLWALRCSNKTSKVEQLLRHYLELEPDNLQYRLLDTFLLPQIYLSGSAMRQWRQRLLQKLEDLTQWLQTAKVGAEQDLIVGSPIFDLMVLGQNEKSSLQKISALWRKLFVPELPQQLSVHTPGQKIRLAWISFSVYEHSTMAYFKSLMLHFAQEADFSTAVFYFGQPYDGLTAQIAESVDYFLQLELHLETGIEKIQAWQPDIVFYLDIGQEAMLYTMAHYRLARLQCVSSGIPITTGISTIDYYLSCQSFEAEGAQANYSEKLIQLPHPPWSLEQPLVTEPAFTRQDFGLPQDKTLYLFPHTLFRLDPDLDTVLAEILRQDPHSAIVAIRYRQTFLHENILRRWKQKCLDLSPERVYWLPWLPQQQFLHLLNLVDLALDGFYLGGGLVTYQCFARGLPLVHLPTDQLRCRVASGLYKIAGLEEWIAQDRQDYSHKALLLGRDRTLRDSLRSQLLAAGPAIFGEQRGLQALAQFFRQQF
jgi:predicted O-linked N-acetylglucosamine transferase (SPINDLY family)